jgi:retron-type reverse transcriptase
MTDLLTDIASASTLRTAFARVRDNHGCAGADGVGIAAYERDLDVNLFALEAALREGTYRPFPLLRILVDRGDGSARQLLVPTVRDRVAQTATLEILRPLFEAEFETCSFGYRRGCGVRDAVMQVKRYYDHGYRWVVEADIDAYFDSVEHGILLARLRDLLDGRKAGDERRKGRSSPPPPSRPGGDHERNASR